MRLYSSLPMHCGTKSFQKKCSMVFKHCLHKIMCNMFWWIMLIVLQFMRSRFQCNNMSLSYYPVLIQAAIQMVGSYE